MRRATVSRFRPYTKDELTAIARQLSDTYRQAEKELLQILAEGNLTDWGEAFTGQQLAQVRAVSEQLTVNSEQWMQTHLPTLYKRGMWVADGHLEPGGLSKAANPGEWTPMDLGMTRMHKEAVEIIAENAATSLGDANAYVGQRIEDMVARAKRIARMSEEGVGTAMAEQLTIRDATLQTMQQAFAQGQTRQQATKAFLADLRQRGVTSFVDKAGKQWDMETYSQMVTRTVSQEAQRHGTQNRLIERDHDLVEISVHENPCPLCEPWEGEVLSLQGERDGYLTMEEATADGLFHPNCAHSALPFLSDKDRSDDELQEQKDRIDERRGERAEEDAA